MNLNRMTVEGTTDTRNGLEQAEPETAQRLERSWPAPCRPQWLNAPGAVKTHITSCGANLLSLQTEMRQHAENGFWIVVVL